jgi:hypothetical protein
MHITAVDGSAASNIPRPRARNRCPFAPQVPRGLRTTKHYVIGEVDGDVSVGEQ